MHELFEKALKSNDPEVLKLAIQLAKNPLYQFTPRPDRPELLDQQTSFCNSGFTDDFHGITCCLSGNGAGKTLAASWRVSKFLFENPPPEFNTPFWVLSQNMDMVSGSVWSQNLAKFILPENIKAITWHSAVKSQPKTIVLNPHSNGNNYILEFKSYDQGRSALQAANIAGFLCDEQCPFEIITELLARTRKWTFKGNMTYTVTPILPDPKLEEIFENQDKWVDWHFFRQNTRCNNAINPDFVRQIERNEVDALIDTRLVGSFAQYEGACFKEFNSRIHVIDDFNIPKQWFVWRAIDLGFTHETACIWLARDLEDHIFVFREYSQTKTSVEQHVNVINADWDYWLNRGDTFIDQAGAQIIHEMELKGLKTKPSDKDMLSGIGAIQSTLRMGKDGNPKLRIFRTCPNLIRQIRSAVWDKDKVNTIKKETPTTLRGLLDALRYALNSTKKPLTNIKPLEQPVARKMNF